MQPQQYTFMSERLPRLKQKTVIEDIYLALYPPQWHTQ